MATIVPERRKKKKERGGVRPTPAYMVTFGDMMNLLLTFFILLLTTATIQGREFKLILSAFTGSFGMMPGGLTLSKGKLAEMGMTIETLPAREQGRKLSKARKQALHIFKPEIKAKRVRIREDERGLVITLMNDAYFEKGSADLIPQTKEVLYKVAQLLTSPEIKNKVRIEGHTDNTPLRRKDFPRDNWELSTQRSVNVVKYLIDNGVEADKLSAAGYGEYKPLPGNTNKTPEERAQNRRVEIILLWEESQL
ncbi:MAG: flagellar motor protein MotB [Spirochaetes bacterium]|nr:flagellar motor protein MotB [Spirochaetota bacterium]